MDNYRIDPKKQFSKRLARWTAWFWFLYMTYLATIMLVQPQTGLYSVYLSIVVSAVMIVNVYTYLKNSVAEKILLSLIERTKLQLSLSNTNKDGDGDEESITPEKESNG